MKKNYIWKSIDLLSNFCILHHNWENVAKLKGFLYSLGTLSGIRIQTILHKGLIDTNLLELFRTAERIDLLP